MTDKIIEKYFTSPDTGFIDAAKLFEKIKEDGHKISLKQVKDWYNKQEVNQVYKQPNVVRKYNKITCPFNTVGCLQIDLMDISNMSRQNNGIHFILNCVDIYSRYVWSFPLKNKTATSTHDAIEKVILAIKKVYPNNTLSITTDEGKEFEGKNKGLIEKYNILRFYADPQSITNHTHMAIVERYNRTLLNKISKYQQFTNSLSFIDKLDSFTDNYNKSKHSTIKMKPYDVFHKDIKYVQEQNIKNNQLDIGDHVRTIKKIKGFEKKTLAQKYSEQIYEIENKIGFRYELKNKNGVTLKKKYLERELLKVDKNDAEVDKTIAEVEEEPAKESFESKVQKNKKFNKNKRLQIRDFKPGHEVAEITDNNEVVYKARLQPTHEKRERKAPKRLNI